MESPQCAFYVAKTKAQCCYKAKHLVADVGVCSYHKNKTFHQIIESKRFVEDCLQKQKKQAENKMASSSFVEKLEVNQIPIYNNEKEYLGFFTVSLCDVKYVKLFTWHIHPSTGYVMNNKGQTVHECLLGKAKPGCVTDHINKDKLDNRRENLNPEASPAENSHNKDTHGEYRGVHGLVSPYKASYSSIHIGCYKTKLEAAVAYDIYVYNTFKGKRATNGLISYQEAIARKEEIKKNPRKEATNIRKAGKRFEVKLIVNKTKLTYSTRDEDEAKAKLEEFKAIEREIRGVTRIQRNSDGVAIIYVGSEKLEVSIDDDMYQHCIKYNYYMRKGRVVRDETIETGKRTIFLAREVVPNQPDELCIKVINDPMDYRRDNIDFITKQTANYLKPSKAGEKPGVEYSKTAQKWRVRLAGKHIGWYANEKDAVISCNNAAKEMFGRYAREYDVPE